MCRVWRGLQVYMTCVAGHTSLITRHTSHVTQVPAAIKLIEAEGDLNGQQGLMSLLLQVRPTPNITTGFAY